MSGLNLALAFYTDVLWACHAIPPPLPKCLLRLEHIPMPLFAPILIMAADFGLREILHEISTDTRVLYVEKNGHTREQTTVKFV